MCEKCEEKALKGNFETQPSYCAETPFLKTGNGGLSFWKCWLCAGDGFAQIPEEVSQEGIPPEEQRWMNCPACDGAGYFISLRSTTFMLQQRPEISHAEIIEYAKGREHRMTEGKPLSFEEYTEERKRKMEEDKPQKVENTK